ncbi:MAG TPA: carboxy terminal-processing peptidase [Kofleriaceae bacterium]|nr:carboxy terminal-processing peptidase [Kofleriaceae bacterium]
MRRFRLAATLLALASVVVPVGACSGKRQSAPTPTVTAASASPAVADPPDPREAALAGVVLHLLEERHLLQRKLDDKVSEAALTAFLDRLDPGKVFLLASDRQALAAYADKIDDEMESGRLDLAHEAAARFHARIGVVAPMVASILAKPLDLSNDETIETDPDKLAPVATDAELRERWRQRLELEILDRTAPPLDPPKPGDPPAPAPLPLAQREDKARADLATSYAGRFARLGAYDVRDAEADLINAIASIYDPHTDYLPPADKANFDIAISGSVEGIGALLKEHDHYVEVQELVPGGAAWREGHLQAGDIIMSVQSGGDPVDVADMRIEDVVKLIRGPKGTEVHLKVHKADGSDKVIDIVRDIVEIEAAYARGAVLQGAGLPAIGYIYLPSFYGGEGRDAATDVRKLLGELQDRKVAGVILDLRDNGGGLLDDAVDLTGLFIDKGPVVQVRDGDGDTRRLSDDDAGTSYAGPLVVMVDHFSASASEIVAAALQDYQRAVIVGTGPTHGKGTVQSLNSLDRATGDRFDLGSLKLTIQQFYRVNGWSTQLDGVTPDVVLPDPAAYVESGERTLPHAIPQSHIDPVDHDEWPAPWKATVLAQKSAARVAKEPLFAQVVASTKLMMSRKGDTTMPLQRTAFEAKRKQQHDELQAVMPDLDKAPARLTVTLLDPPPAPAAPGQRVDDRLTKWQAQLARDPWLAEAAHVLDDSRH